MSRVVRLVSPAGLREVWGTGVSEARRLEVPGLQLPAPQLAVLQIPAAGRLLRHLPRQGAGKNGCDGRRDVFAVFRIYHVCLWVGSLIVSTASL